MPTPPPDRAALARERLAAKRWRASNLRRRVVAGALAAFALAWGVIAFNGPMGVKATTATTTATTTASTTASNSASNSRSTSTDNATSSGHTVTTAQS